MTKLITSTLVLFLVYACQSEAQQTDSQVVTFQNVGVSQFAKLMTQDDVVILDVRTPAETAEGKIDGAIEIDIREGNFSESIKDMDKNKTYLVYCKSGGRSSSACEIMAKEGFKKLYNLDGGYTEWSDK